MPSFRSQAAVIAAAAAVLLPAGASAVAATTAPNQTRTGYREAVEPICETGTRANGRILVGVRRRIGAGELKAAGVAFGRAATAFGATTARIARIPQPEADATRLAKWLGLLREEARILDRISVALRAGEKGQAQHQFLRLTANGNRANVTVLPFDFRYCRIEASRFE